LVVAAVTVGTSTVMLNKLISLDWKADPLAQPVVNPTMALLLPATRIHLLIASTVVMVEPAAWATPLQVLV
jgi:hypothetical protein